MFAGNVTKNIQLRFLGTHQKFNRKAFRLIKQVVRWPHNDARSNAVLARFPGLRSIHYFEGHKGPDGLKYKSPNQNEPLHFYNPESSNNKEFFDILGAHYKKLVSALKKEDSERAAFEASWLAHAITDGLTPAHHFPYEEEIEAARGAQRDQATSTLGKLFIAGESTIDTIRKNWTVIGGKGTITTHTNYEAGAGVTLFFLRIPRTRISGMELAFARSEGYQAVFEASASNIAGLRMYQRFYEKGWTIRLIRDVRLVQAPTTIKTIALIWLLALEEATA